MSWMMRENRRQGGEHSGNDIFRRMACFRRNIFGAFPRLGGGRRNQNFPSNFEFQYPQSPTTNVPEEWTFLTSFEQQYGSTHPLFYVCGFMEALKIAEDENKFLFVYLHSPEHPFTPSFCKETLCSESVVQFLDANFVSWGAIANRGEGLQIASTLRASSYPFCAVVAPAPGSSIAVLQQMEGPMTPAELIDNLQRTLEEQGLAFGSGRAKQEEKIKADRRLREEQDAAYLAALQIDKEKERLRNLALEGKVQKPEASNKFLYRKPKDSGSRIQSSKVIYPNANGSMQQRENTTRGKDAQLSQILIRFPNGEKREQSFSCKDKIQSIYHFIDSLQLPGVTNYRLVSSFPRKIYGVDQMGITLKDAGLYPRASLFLELV